MGEEEKKPEEKKMEEKKPEESKKPEEKKEEPKAEKPSEDKKKAEESKDPPPPPEIVLSVYMHCEGCARKVRRCLKNFEGVEDVQTDCKTHKVVVKGAKADPVKVLDRVQKKSHRQVELLSPIPKPPAPEDAKKAEEKEVAKPEKKKAEPPVVITVVLKVYMHCEACAQEIKRRILRMNGVESIEPDLKSSQVTVKGVFDPPKLVEYVYKKTGKQAVIVKQETEKKKEEKAKEEKKADDGGGKDTEKGETAAKEKKDGGGEAAAAAAVVVVEGEEEAAKVVELKKNEFYYNYPQNYQINPNPYPYAYAYPYPYQHHHPPPPPPPPARVEFNDYPPQMFSDENPNACSVM